MDSLIRTASGDLAAQILTGTPAWRIGFRPRPWAWTPWELAPEAGHFTGRWDDPVGSFRTIYGGETLLACLLEVLARFRPDPHLEEDLGRIVEDHIDNDDFPTLPPGQVPISWLSRREASRAGLSGAYCLVTDKESLPTLRSRFLSTAINYGLADLDAGVLRLSAPRALTQDIAAWLYELHDAHGHQIDGVNFQSRHGDGQTLWAVFERGEDGDVSSRISHPRPFALNPDNRDLVEAFRLHRLAWAPAAPYR